MAASNPGGGLQMSRGIAEICLGWVCQVSACWPGKKWHFLILAPARVKLCLTESGPTLLSFQRKMQVGKQLQPM